MPDESQKEAPVTSLVRSLWLLVVSLTCLLIVLMSASPRLSIEDETGAMKRLKLRARNGRVRLPVGRYLFLRSETELGIVRITSNLKITRPDSTVFVATSEWMLFHIGLPESLEKPDEKGMTAACEIDIGDKVYPGSLRCGDWSLEWRSGNWVNIPPELQYAIPEEKSLSQIDVLSLSWQKVKDSEDADDSGPAGSG